jgi:hypothetical protein
MADEDVARSRTGLFVVRIAGEQPALSGRVEHVLSGEKCVFSGLEELGEALVRMTRRELEQRGKA